jgi:hypothetical protein
MSVYADHARIRPEPPVPVATASAPRLSISRRTLLDVPAAVAASSGQNGSILQAGGGGAAGRTDTFDGDLMRNVEADTDFQTASAFDVPAFLRRQEG